MISPRPWIHRVRVCRWDARILRGIFGETIFQDYEIRVDGLCIDVR
jgi:hypothetical protein